MNILSMKETPKEGLKTRLFVGLFSLLNDSLCLILRALQKDNFFQNLKNIDNCLKLFRKELHTTDTDKLTDV